MMVRHTTPEPRRPYYEDDAVTLYLGDCRDVLPEIEADVLVTDPPYGIELGTQDYRRNHGSYATTADTYEDYVTMVVPVVEGMIARTKRAAVFVGPHYREMPKAEAIGGIYHPSASGRTGWGFKTFLPVLLYGTSPNRHLESFATTIYSTATVRRIDHPCPKPIEWMRWLVGLATEVHDVVIDPFAGSGTTLRAAKDLGRKAIGIEIEERYCEEAARKCAQEVLA
jgi:DNA modification methylase